MNLYREPYASLLEGRRVEARMKRRITFDCYLAKANGNERVHCKHLPQSVPLLSVLSGRSTKICQDCPHYDDGGEME